MANNSFYKLKNIIQDYPWGSKTSIPELFGIANTEGKPMAEIWMGAHPKSSSVITIDGQEKSLCRVINDNPGQMIGTETQDKYGELPFLFKVLAAEKALSIQVHPTKEEAVSGYNRENEKGIDLSAFERNYKDANHKPELVFALTPYLAMNGFRPYEQILELFSAINSLNLQRYVNRFSENLNENGLRDFFSTILSLTLDAKTESLAALLEWAKTSESSVADLVIELNELYPNDIGLLAPLMLNVVLLKPGEAMFLHAGTPHAYLKGTALEIMANSDNVLRAGLTPKHIDVPELVDRCRFTPMDPNNILCSPEIKESEHNFPVPVDDFSFSIYVNPVKQVVTMKRAEIWLALEQNLILEDEDGQSMTIKKGESAFVPFATQSIRVTSLGRVARAF
jgi:mannose-6-phosphate isomerase